MDDDERKELSDHRSMPVYADSLELNEIAQRVAERIRRRRPDLADQVERSSGSVLLNLGEGANEFAPGDKARFYRFAQRSAGETHAAFDLIIRLRLEEQDAPRGRALALSIASQMAGLAITMAQKARKRPPPGPAEPPGRAKPPEPPDRPDSSEAPEPPRPAEPSEAP